MCIKLDNNCPNRENQSNKVKQTGGTGFETRRYFRELWEFVYSLREVFHKGEMRLNRL